LLLISIQRTADRFGSRFSTIWQVEQEEPLVVGVDEATQQSYLKLPEGYHW
jgi:hypothetical protein